MTYSGPSHACTMQVSIPGWAQFSSMQLMYAVPHSWRPVVVHWISSCALSPDLSLAARAAAAADSDRLHSMALLQRLSLSESHFCTTLYGSTLHAAAACTAGSACSRKHQTGLTALWRTRNRTIGTIKRAHCTHTVHCPGAQSLHASCIAASAYVRAALPAHAVRRQRAFTCCHPCSLHRPHFPAAPCCQVCLHASAAACAA